MKHLKAVTACNAVCVANCATLWSNTGSCSGWSEIQTTGTASCQEWSGFCGGSTCISTPDNAGYDISYIQHVSTVGYDNIRVKYDVMPESFEGKEDDHCYVKYSNNGGNSWTLIGDHDTKDQLDENQQVTCNNAAENNPNFEVKFQTVNKGGDGSCCDYCNWLNMNVLGTFIPTPQPTKSPTKKPTPGPSKKPTISPTKNPTNPTTKPTKIPTKSPTKNPSKNPTKSPTNPTDQPSKTPTKSPTKNPSKYPTNDPTKDPTMDPTYDPTSDPTFNPSPTPTFAPTASPTYKSGEVGDPNHGIHNTENGNQDNDHDSLRVNEGNTSIVGIIVGLLSFLLCVCSGVFIYFRYFKSKGKIQFTNENKLKSVTSVSTADSLDGFHVNGTGGTGDAYGHQTAEINYGLTVQMHNMRENKLQAMPINVMSTNDSHSGSDSEILNDINNNTMTKGGPNMMSTNDSDRSDSEILNDINNNTMTKGGPNMMVSHVHAHGEGNGIDFDEGTDEENINENNTDNYIFTPNGDEFLEDENEEDSTNIITPHDFVTKGNDNDNNNNNNEDEEDSVDNLQNKQEGNNYINDVDIDDDIISEIQIMTPNGNEEFIIDDNESDIATNEADENYDVDIDNDNDIINELQIITPDGNDEFIINDNESATNEADENYDDILDDLDAVDNNSYVTMK